MREDQEKQIDRPNSQDEDSHNNTPPAARLYEAEGNIEYLDRIKRVDAIRLRKNQDILTEKLQLKEVE